MKYLDTSITEFPFHIKTAPERVPDIVSSQTDLCGDKFIPFTHHVTIFIHRCVPTGNAAHPFFKRATISDFTGAGQLSGTVHSFQNVTLLLYDEQTMVASRLEDTTSCSQLQNRSHTQSPLHATARGAAFRWRFVPQHTTPYPRWSVAVAACDASELSLTYELGFVNSAEPWWSAQLSCEASLALPLAFAYLFLMAPLAVLLLRSAWRERARHPEPPSDAADAPPPPPRHLPIASLGAAAACAAPSLSLIHI